MIRRVVGSSTVLSSVEPLAAVAMQLDAVLLDLGEFHRVHAPGLDRRTD